MDRLPLVAAAIAVAAAVVSLAAACGSDDDRAPPSRQRVAAVTSTAPEVNLEAFCDVLAEPGHGTPFALPELAAPAPPSDAGWRWVNLWATWCDPCIEELPLMASWITRLRARDLAIALELVSVDESDEVVAAFRARHPATPDSLRIADPDALEPWLETLGLATGASIPIHIFVDPTGAVRCLRVAGVSESDYAAVAHLLAGD
jgi:thiol-disulfide isomerase/thioredoxin